MAAALWGPGQLLKEDGILGAALSSVSLRNGEAVIVYHPTAPAPGRKPLKGVLNQLK